MQKFDFNTLLEKVQPPQNWTDTDIKAFLKELKSGFSSLDEVYEALGDLRERNVNTKMVQACIVMRQLASHVETVRCGQTGYSASQQHRYQLKIDVLMSALRAKEASE